MAAELRAARLVAALFTVVSGHGFAEVLGGDRVADPSRIAAQIVSGVGFLGAGVIFTRSNVVHGLTTAATVWVVAAVGMACGAGLPLPAIAVTLMYLISIPLLALISRKMPAAHRAGVLRLRYRDGEGVLRTILGTASDMGFRSQLLDSALQEEEAQRTVEVTARFTGKPPERDLIAALAALPGVNRVSTAAESSRRRS